MNHGLIIPGALEPILLKPLGIVTKNYKIGVILALCVLIAGIPVVMFKGKLTYSTTAVVYVGPRFVNILEDRRELSFDSYQQFRQFVEQQSRTISRYDIIMKALDSLGIDRYLWQAEGESDRKAGERLQHSMTIQPVKNTYLITVELSSDTPTGLDRIVNAVVDTYVDTVKSENVLFEADTRLLRLKQRRDEIISAIETDQARRTNLAQELGVTTFVEVALNPYDELLLESRIALEKAKREQSKAEAEFDVINPEKGDASRIALETLSASLVTKDAGLNSLKASLFEKRSELVRQLSGLDSVHPLYQQLVNEMEDIDRELSNSVDKLSNRIQKSLLEERRNALTLAQNLVEKLVQQIEQYSDQAAWFASRYNEALSISAEKERFQNQLQMINSRIDFLQIESQAPGFIRVETRARPPQQPSGGGKKKWAIILIAVSGLTGLSIPICIHFLDRTIKTAPQLEKVIGHKPLAVILEYSTERIVRHVIIDQMKRLLLALERDRKKNKDLRSLLITSVKPAAGVTSFAFEMSLHYAETGVSTIVVEVNAMKPDVRYTGDMETYGLLDIVVDDSLLDQAIIPAQGLLPDRLSIGLAVDRHLHAYSRITEIIESLKKRYDLVLIDSPPVLLSADVEYLMGMANSTLLLVGANQVHPRELKRAMQIIERVRPPLIQYLFTRLKIYRGGGYNTEMMEYVAAEKLFLIRNFPTSRAVQELES